MSGRKAAFITGGGIRVGAALCTYFAQQGYDIALHYHASDAGAQQVRQTIESHGVSCGLFPCDLSDSAGLSALMERVQQAMPHCRVLINSASIFDQVSFMDTDKAVYERQFDINFKAPFFLTQAFARLFGQGCVINILDTDITKSHGSHFAYLLTKKTLAEFTQMAARALAPAIRVNGVCPGHVAFDGEDESELAAKLRQLTPMQAHAAPQGVAEAAYWLTTQPHITGQWLFVDGGKHVL